MSKWIRAVERAVSRPNVITVLVLLVWVLGGSLESATGANSLIADEGGLDRIVIQLYGNVVQWNEAPASTLVRATIGRDGHPVAEAEAISSIDGTVTLGLKANNGDFFLSPGDTLLLQPLTGASLQLSIPAIHADLDRKSNTIFGLAPTNQEISVALDDRDPTTGAIVVRPIDAQAVRDGTHFSIALQGFKDTRPGDTARVTFKANGVACRIRVAAFAVETRLERRELAISASLGTTIQVALAGVDSIPVFSRTIAIQGSPEVLVTIPESVGAISGKQLQIVATSSVEELLLPVVDATVPDLRLWVDLEQDEVSGLGPMDTLLNLQLRDPTRTSLLTPTAAVEVRTDATGNFTRSFRSAYDIQGGWRVSLRFTVSDELTVSTAANTRSIRATVFGQSIEAYLADLTLPITVTLLSATGEVKLRGSAQVARGKAIFWMKQRRQDGEIRIMPGDHIEIASSNGDPILVTVPEFDARIDSPRGALIGSAPAGSRIRLTYADQAGTRVRRYAIADDDGHYAFAAGDNLVLSPGMSGSVALISSRDDEFELSWVVPQITLDLTLGQVYGNGPWGQNVFMRVLDGSGHTLAKLDERVAGAPDARSYHQAGAWRIQLRDEAGQALYLRPGDRIDATIGPDTVQMTVPSIQVTLDAGTDKVSGHTNLQLAPMFGHLWRAPVYGGSREGRPIILHGDSGSSGFWQWDVSGSGGIAALDSLDVFLTVGSGQLVVVNASASGITVDLSSGTISGFIRPGADASTSLLRRNAVIGFGATRSAIDGAISMNVADVGGHPLVPEEGDDLVVSTGLLTETMRITVPRFEARLDMANKTVAGFAEGDGPVSVSVQPTFRVAIEDNNPNDGRAATVPDKTGQFNIPFAEILSGDTQPLMPSPGAEFKIRHLLAGGMFVQRSAYVPLINVEHGGSQVCGIAPPLKRVTAELRNDRGSTLAAGTGVTGSDARFSIRLRDASGQPKRAGMSQTLAVQVDGMDVKVILPQLKTSVEPGVIVPTQSALSLYRISGVSSAYTDYFVTEPLKGCFTGLMLGSTDDGRTGRDGAFSTVVNPPVPGDGVEIAFRTGAGQRYFRHLRRLRLDAYVGTAMLTLLGTAGSSVDVELRRADQVLASQSVILDEDGRGRVDFRSVAGKIVVLQAGDRIQANDGVTSEHLDLIALSIDGDAATGLFGRTDPRQRLAFQLRLRDGRTPNLQVEADLSGTFRFRDAELPPRRDWSMADVTTFMVLAPDPSGHRTVVEGRLGADPADPKIRRLFLPWQVR